MTRFRRGVDKVPRTKIESEKHGLVVLNSDMVFVYPDSAVVKSEHTDLRGSAVSSPRRWSVFGVRSSMNSDAVSKLQSWR